MLDVGDVDDLGHYYVPRILELLTVDKEAWDTLRIGWIWRFSGIGRPDWRPAECEAVLDFFDALLRATLEDAVPVHPW